MKKISLIIYYVLTFIPLGWIFLYILWILSNENKILGMSSLILFIISGHVIWVWHLQYFFIPFWILFDSFLSLILFINQGKWVLFQAKNIMDILYRSSAYCYNFFIQSWGLFF
jgi:hypothetical protein